MSDIVLSLSWPARLFAHGCCACIVHALEALQMVKGRSGIPKVTTVAQSSGFAALLAPRGRFALVQNPLCSSDVSSCALIYWAEQVCFLPTHLLLPLSGFYL